MTLRIGDIAPDFKAETTEGSINFHEFIGDSWAILFSHPKDYTPVCTTELGMVSKLQPEFKDRNVKTIGLSVDSLEDHKGWSCDVKETQSCSSLDFPIIADTDKSIAEQYDMIHPSESDSFTVRTVFVIGPDKKIKLMFTYPMGTGRNFEEILRVIDSLQRTEECIIPPSISDEEAARMFPEGFRSEKPYLRYVADPKHKLDKAKAA